MKKILYFIIPLILLVTRVKALEMIPHNIYYYDDGLYAYLENKELEDDLYIEYLIIDGENEKKLDLIKVEDLVERNHLLDDELDNIKTLKIKARYVIDSEEKDYSDWSSEATINTFDFKDMVMPEIEKFEPNPLSYEISNKTEISNQFYDYIKIYNAEIYYKEEFSINDGNWVDKLPEVDLNDVKIDFRISYNISNHESPKSNVLTYEKHPEPNICMFGTDICCSQFFHISICIWALTIFIFLVIILIYIDNKKRKAKEA